MSAFRTGLAAFFAPIFELQEDGAVLVFSCQSFGLASVIICDFCGSKTVVGYSLFVVGWLSRFAGLLHQRAGARTCFKCLLSDLIYLFICVLL